MRVMILTSGTRGDVQPYVALARQFLSDGHDAWIVTHEEFRSFVTEHGVEFVPIPGEVREFLSSGDWQEITGQRTSTMQTLKTVARWYERYLPEFLRIGIEQARQADVIVCSFSILFVAETIAEVTGKLLVNTVMHPLAPTNETYAIFQRRLHPRLSWLKSMGWYRGTQELALKLYTSVFGPVINRVRQSALGLPPRYDWLSRESFQNSSRLTLYGYSEQVSPRPTDWSPTQQVTGYWLLPRDGHWTPPAELQDFLNAGPPPVYFGYGSMRDADPRTTLQMVEEALNRTNSRGVLVAGWSDASSDWSSERLFVTNNVPHDWLFPRMAAVVHHGGAGTTAAGLLAGAPTLIVPVIADQAFWGRRMEDLGVGPGFIPRTRLTVDRLTAALQAMIQSSTMRERASDIGARLAAENGTVRAVRLIERFLQTGDATRVAVPSERERPRADACNASLAESAS